MIPDHHFRAGILQTLALGVVGIGLGAAVALGALDMIRDAIFGACRLIQLGMTAP